MDKKIELQQEYQTELNELYKEYFAHSANRPRLNAITVEYREWVNRKFVIIAEIEKIKRKLKDEFGLETDLDQEYWNRYPQNNKKPK